MQNFKLYDYTITPAQIAEALKDGRQITAIINGEYYDVKPDAEAGTEANPCKK